MQTSKEWVGENLVGRKGKLHAKHFNTAWKNDAVRVAASQPEFFEFEVSQYVPHREAALKDRWVILYSDGDRTEGTRVRLSAYLSYHTYLISRVIILI